MGTGTEQDNPETIDTEQITKTSAESIGKLKYFVDDLKTVEEHAFPDVTRFFQTSD